MGWRERYYGDCIAEAAAEMGLSITSDQVTGLAESVCVSAENEGLSSGAHCIPNPLESEVRRVERARSDDAKDADKLLAATKTEADYTIRHLRYRINDLERELDRVQRAA